jgi:hypothetical protein
MSVFRFKPTQVAPTAQARLRTLLLGDPPMSVLPTVANPGFSDEPANDDDHFVEGDPELVARWVRSRPPSPLLAEPLIHPTS